MNTSRPRSLFHLSFSGLAFRSEVLLSAALAFASGAVQAQFIKENQVTEEAMVRALKPAGEVAPGGLTRSMKITPHATGSKPSTAQSDSKNKASGTSSGSAPILLTFETNSAELTDRARKALDVIARSLTHADLAGLNFAIEGHADPRGKHEENLLLSRQRAESVRAYLIAQHNIPEQRLKAVGKGDTELVIPKNPSAAENRRVTFVTLQ
jgi:OmpA-OmpF porin, OOP family